MQVDLCKSSTTMFDVRLLDTDRVTRRTKTPWINPFNVNKNLILEEVGVELGIDYATVCEQGPS